MGGVHTHLLLPPNNTCGYTIIIVSYRALKGLQPYTLLPVFIAVEVGVVT